MKYQKEQQKLWLNQQMEEKRERKRKEKENENNYAQYMKEVTRVRGELEEKFLQTKKQNQINMMNFNQRMGKKNQIQKENNKRDHYLSERDYLQHQEEIRRDTDFVPDN